jgi:hypothetical protein
MKWLLNKIRHYLFVVLPVASALVSTPASAVSITYLLQTTNEYGFLPDPENYISVTIEEVADDIKFTVMTLDAFDTHPFHEGTNFGMQTFGFNIDDSFLAGLGYAFDADNIEFLSPESDWDVRSRNLSEFGRFDVVLAGNGNSRLDELVFLITGIDGDNIFTYAAPTLQDPDSGGWFAAHVAGFAFGETHITSAWFAGGDGSVPPNLIPLPAAIWLFGSGLVGLVSIAWRKRQA